MKLWHWGYPWGCGLAIASLGWGWNTASYGQAIAPDGSLNTVVSTPNNLDFTITNGTAAGRNLFHSFQGFSVPAGGSATFNLVNTPNISTLFSRVTGGNLSAIDGLLQTINSTGPVNLFLVNPNGILFGPGARLNISGSFVGTTANSIQFADGTEFRATNLTGSPLLTISVPIGLQFGQRPQPIAVQGPGGSDVPISVFSPIAPDAEVGLQVQPGNTLALIGGPITIQGGILKTVGGRIELASVGDAGVVDLIPAPPGLTVSTARVPSLGDITITQQARIDGSGGLAGTIQIQGRAVNITRGSVVLAQNQGPFPAGEIRIRGTESVELSGVAPTGNIPAAITSETVGPGQAGPIFLSTRRLTLLDGGFIGGRTFSDAAAGDIYIEANESVQIVGFLPTNPTQPSRIGSASLGPGPAGNLRVSTDQLALRQGGALSSTTFSSGDGGDVTVNAQAITLSGATPALFNSMIDSSNLGSGQAGNLILNTRTVQLQAAGSITSSSVNRGAAGSVTLNASESVEINGKDAGGNQPSFISSAVGPANAVLRSLFTLPEVPNAASGDVLITTPVLRVLEGGQVSVQNAGMGDGGELIINADVIQLDRQGNISAGAASGEGGNLFLQAEIVQLRRNSTITATAGGTGNGGNISITAPIILGLENSDIIANAFQGNGGNIQITTQGIFGLQSRPQATSENDITASSELGLNGTVQINTLGVDPNAAFVPLPMALVDSSQLIASGCDGNKEGSEFIITGRGGLPPGPFELLRGHSSWVDLRDGLPGSLPMAGGRQAPAAFPRAIATPLPSLPQPALIEATGWYRHANGKVELVANYPVRSPFAQSGVCGR
jgi:filamentous hemagglutinin family protein